MRPFTFITAFFASLLLARAQAVVDSSTLNGKFILGYQGWHACQGDGNPLGTYVHWSHSAAAPSTSDMVDDIWPDLSE
ncbi:MAG: lectin, partial [Limisphaerales bacterium]